jgi:hypothetical protein
MLGLLRRLFNVNRRKFLGGGAALGAIGTATASAQNANALVSDMSSLKVSVTLNGATYTYPEGPKIPSYYVDFREDGRVLFHLGELGDLTTGKTVPPYHLGPHRVRIEKGATVLLDAEVPLHWWNAQWTHRLSPMKRTRTPEQIVAANRMFKYGDAGVALPPQHNFSFKGAMDDAGVTRYMPTTGERGDIGLITDNSAYYMLGESPGPMVAWALAAGSIPMHFRDEATGRPIDLIKYPSANAYDAPGLQGSPYLLKGEPNPEAPEYTKYGGGWVPQQAHYPELSYVAYYATGDLGFLEDLQYSANFTVLDDAYTSNHRGVATIKGEVRGLAWGLRNLFMANIATKDLEGLGPLPSWLHPSSYWKTLLDNALSFYTPVMDGPIQQAFSKASPDGRYSPWMHDYLCLSLAFGVLTGHSDWNEFYLFNLGNIIKRTNGSSGWPVAYCTPYRMNASSKGEPGPPLTWKQAFDEVVTDPEMKVSQAEHDALVADQYHGGKYAPVQNWEYGAGTRAVLVMASYLDRKGILAVRQTYPELDKCVASLNSMVQGALMNPRVSIIM